jgi:hypothetical protein
MEMSCIDRRKTILMQVGAFAKEVTDKTTHQSDVFVSSARITKKLLKLYLYEITSALIATKRSSYKDTFLQLVNPVSV